MFIHPSTHPSSNPSTLCCIQLLVLTLNQILKAGGVCGLNHARANPEHIAKHGWSVKGLTQGAASSPHTPTTRADPADSKDSISHCPLNFYLLLLLLQAALACASAMEIKHVFEHVRARLGSPFPPALL